MKNRNFWLSLVLLISLGVTAIDITRAVNPPMPTIPGECEFLRAPTSGVLGSRQTPDPVEVGDTFTVEWHITGDGGGYIPAHPDKNSPPPEQPLDKWGTHGKRFDGEGSADFWTEPVTYRARLTGSTTVEYFFGDLNYFNPCDKSYHTANTPTAIHTPNIIPRPPDDVPRPPDDDDDDDDGPPPPGIPPPPEEGEGGTITGAEKPDHGEVLGDGEIIDEDSIVTDPDRGDIPTSGKVLVFLDPAPAAPEDLPGGNDFERIVLTHRIVTIDSPDARPLDGTLRLEVVEGDPENFEIHYFDPESSAAQEITSFPFEEMITEPGHHGGGVHDWHSGTVSLNVRAISRPESPEEEPHLILRASADPVQGVPKKTLDVVLLPVEFETFEKDETREIGGDRSPNWKAHKLNLNTRQEEAEHYGDYEKCVAHIWDGQSLNVAKYLAGYDQLKDFFEDPDILNWKVNGNIQQSFELDLTDSSTRPDENKMDSYRIEVLAKDSGQSIDHLIVTVVRPETLTDADQWYADNADTTWMGGLPRLYIGLLGESGGVFPDPNEPVDPEPDTCDPQRWRNGITEFDEGDYYHPDGYFGMRSEVTAGGHGHQAVYDENFVIIQSGISAGSVDRGAPFDILDPLNTSTTAHRDLDVVPFIRLAQLDGNPVEGTEGAVDNLNLTAPVMHDGSFLGRYFERRPAVVPGSTFLQPNTCP